jgi:hypothetical protein
MKQTIRLNEAELKQIIREAIDDITNFDENIVDELFLYARNDRDYYFRMAEPVVKALLKKDPATLTVERLANSSIMQKHIKFLTDKYSKEIEPITCFRQNRKELAKRLAEWMLEWAEEEREQ